MFIVFSSFTYLQLYYIVIRFKCLPFYLNLFTIFQKNVHLF
nr:MAG TPA: hypothetical protein [Caudoviricetes sp.]